MSPTLNLTRSAPPPHGRAYRLASLGPFIILAVVAGVLVAHWSQIPPRYPVHWTAGGVANGWATRSFWGVFSLLLIAAVFCLLNVFLGHATLHWAQHPRGATSPDHRRGTAWTLLAASYVLAIVFGTLALLLPLRHALHGPLSVWPVLVAVLVPAAVAVMILFAWRSRPTPPAAPLERERAHAGHWVAGFYYNPDDPTLLVPKRFGYGFTFNMAQPRAWVLLGAIGAAITLALVLSAAAH